MQLDFFNTVHLSGSVLQTAKEACTKQNARILEIMRSGEEFTPIEVWKEYQKIYGNVLLTSIRRGMTTLSDKGLLIMTDNIKDEEYGKPNHLWKISPNPKQ